MITDLVSNQGRAKFIFGSILLMMIFLAIGVFLLWAYFSQLDVSTRAFGVVVPSSHIQTIQSFDGGILNKLYVKEGDVVDKGQILLSMDRVRSQAIYHEALAKKVSLQAAIARLRAEVFATPLQFPKSLNAYSDVIGSQQRLYNKRSTALRDELLVMQRSLELAEKELSLNEPMLVTGEVSEVDVIRLRRQVNEIRGAITQRKNKFLGDAQLELVKAEDDLAVQEQVLNSRRDQFENADIRAPMKGVVKNVRITTEGGVVRPAEEIMQLVPVAEELLVDVKINPADVAFLRPGLRATIKIDAYDSAVYGMLEGDLIYLSPDTLREENAREDIKFYRGTVRTHGKLKSPRRNEKVEIIPGMTAQVSIKTGERSVLDYLLKPITRGLSDSMHER